MNPRAIPTQHTLDFVTGCLTRKECSILEVGCGHGHLALQLQNIGQHVTAIDTSADMVNIAREQGVNAHVQDIQTFQSEAAYDCVLFTRSLHHAHPVEACLDNAKKLLKPHGLLIAEEFALERMDQATATWFYGLKALLAQEQFASPEELIDIWQAEHHAHHHLYTGAEIMQAINDRFELIATTNCAYLYRYFVAGLERQNNPRTLATIFQWEDAQIQQAQIRPLGLRVIARKRAKESDLLSF